MTSHDLNSEQLERFERDLRVVLAALAPYSADVVLIGGWVPVLYRKYGGFSGWTRIPRLTREADVLLNGRLLGTGSRRAIPELLHAAGLKPDADSGAGAAVWRAGSAGPEVEFFVDNPMLAKQPTAPIVGQVGLSAIQFSDLALMLRNQRMLRLESMGTLDAIVVRVPQIGAYAINKALTFHRRRSLSPAGRTKWTKDLLALYELRLAGPVLNANLREDVARMRREDEDARRLISTSVNYLSGFLKEATDSEWQPLVDDVRANDRGLDYDAAQARIEGVLTDFRDEWSKGERE